VTALPSLAWAVSTQQGTVAELHHRSGLSLERRPPDSLERSVTFWRPTAPAIVLGSAQPDSVISPSAAVPVVRRRSGGGAVFVAPGEMVWADVVVPADDELWSDDVGRASWWVGEAWSSALAGIGIAVESLSVHTGRPVTSRWSALACFAGVGPGEVQIDGRKVVGIAQRRSRRGALFQCAALLAWDPSALVSTLAITGDDRAQAVADLAALATSVSVSAEFLETALVRALPVGSTL
jgi:lipoate---protein ligase